METKVYSLNSDFLTYHFYLSQKEPTKYANQKGVGK